jgi:hypothetical protein
MRTQGAGTEDYTMENMHAPSGRNIGRWHGERKVDRENGNRGQMLKKQEI